MEYAPYNPVLATKLKIRRAFAEIRRGRNNKTPFAVGAVEKRMSDWAKENNVEIGSQSLYMSTQSLQHSRREDKQKKGIDVSEKELEDFPVRRYGMDLYYDTHEKNFNYVDIEKRAKYIIEPTYEAKMFKGKKPKIVAHITAQRLSDEERFNIERYKKI